MTRSINQFAADEPHKQAGPTHDAYGTYGTALPNFRNLGIVLRILLAVNLVALIAVVLKTPAWNQFGTQYLETAALVEPLLILVLVVLYLANNVLARLHFIGGAVAVIGIAVLLTAAGYQAVVGYIPMDLSGLSRYCALVALTTVMVLSYFELRGRALSPALTEARLHALQARIRPHFLFNSINAVLSLMRQEPRRAETALEDMAELFRVLMADNRRLTPLSREIALCRQYLALEELRLGDRLKVEWDTDGAPMDALVPPLVLQPLIENAVYHGIEPRTEPGTVSISIRGTPDTVQTVLRNPYAPEADHHAGNHMAVENIRERLQLHFDAEASLTTRVINEGSGDVYEVRITMPNRNYGKAAQ